MKLKKALSLFLTLAMLLGMVSMMAVGVSAVTESTAFAPATEHSKHGYKADTTLAIPATFTTQVKMTTLYEAWSEDAEPKKVLSSNYDLTTTCFIIEDETDLLNFSKMVNNYTDRFFGASVYMTADIDMKSTTGFTPIGNSTKFTASPDKSFDGKFDGLCHKISNLKMTSATNVASDKVVNVALFGCTRSAAIQNLYIDSTCSFTYTGSSATAYTAGVAACAIVPGSRNVWGTYTGTIDVHTSSTTTATSFSVVSLFSNIRCDAAVTASAGVAGGILGTTEGYTGDVNGALIQNCQQANSVTGGTYAGGIVGYYNLNGTASRILVINGCVVRQESNMILAITADTVNACANYVAGKGQIFIDDNKGFHQGYNDYEKAELRPRSSGFDYDQRGYSFSNVKRKTAAEMDSIPNISAYASNSTAKEFKITSASDFLAFANLVNGVRNAADNDWTIAPQTLKGVTVYLANDITDWEGVAMETIGFRGVSTGVLNNLRAPTYYFGGTFDGQGYTIDNLNMSFNTAWGGGLFGFVRGGTVKNMVLGFNCSFTTDTGRAVAPIFMTVAHGGDNCPQVINCFSGATVINNASNGIAAGMVGAAGAMTDAAFLKILYCTNAGTVTSTGDDVTINYNDGTTNTTNMAQGAMASGMLGVTNRYTMVNHCANYGAVSLPNGIAANIGAMIGVTSTGGQLGFDMNVITPTYGTGTANTDYSGLVGTRGGFRQTGTKVDANGNTYASYLGAQKLANSDPEATTVSVRILAVVNSLDAGEVGFDLSINDGEATGSVTTATVYRSIIVDGKTTTAESLGGKYIVAITLENIPVETALTIVNTNTTVGGSTAKTATNVTIQL